MDGLRPAIALVALALASCRDAGPARPLVLAMEQDVLTLDPHRHDDSVTHSVLANVYDPLVTFDGEMRVVPALAVGWSNPTDLTWRFRLRRGVFFHDGRPLRADDVRFSLERARRMRPAAHLHSVNRIDVVDDETIELGTGAPEPVLLNKLASVGIVPRGTPEDVVRPVGTGAYRFVGRAPKESLRLGANEAFWGGALAIREAVFRVIPDATARAAALSRGEIHLARELTRGHLAGARKGVRFVSHPGLVVVVLGVNFRTGGPLLSREVRQAVYWAIDPAELIESSGVEASPVDQVVPPSVFGFLPGRSGTRPQPERARELLRRAGLAKGFDATLEMAEAFAPSVGRALAAQLARVGIRLKVVGLDWSRFSARLDRRESPFFSVGWSCNGDASHLFESMLHTRNGATWGASNFGAYANPELDRAIERAGEILRPDERLAALHEAMRLGLEELPLIPLFNRSRTYGVDDRIVFRPRLNGQVLLREIAWADESGPS
jgi:peptide/nickel transport system substrate-binding protein